MAHIAQILAELERAEDQAEVLKTHVEQAGGLWVEPEPHVRGIVEIQLAGLVGIGPTVATAAEDWILQARTQAQGRSRRVA